MIELPTAPASVLLVDDDKDIRGLVCSLVSGAGIKISAVPTIADAERQIEAAQPDVLLLDLTLPDGDGLDFCARLRATHFTGLILMLTARSGLNDRLKGFEGGADDYLAKPFSSRELLARLRIHLRHVEERRSGRPKKARFACFGKWRLDLVRRRLVAPDDTVVMISTAEFDILYRLVSSPGIELTREELVPERGQTVYFDRSFDNRLSRLRAKIALHSDGMPVILTVRNRGFIIASDISFE